jgi:hypothetical protein
LPETVDTGIHLYLENLGTAMSISQLRAMLTDGQWRRFKDDLESACDNLSVIRKMSGKKADEIRELWDALHITENLLSQIDDLENSDCECDDDD